MDNLHISLSSLSKFYVRGNQKNTVLNNVDVTINKGEFVAIIGPSGSGKSTLLQMIGGLDRPSEGNVRIDDKNLNELSDNKLSEFRNQNIGFVFQFFYLQPFLTVSQNIQLPGMFNEKKFNRTERASYLADLLGISDIMGRLPKELSGGQIQRCAIARSLFNNPSLLLADEPTGNLDSANADIIVGLFESINQHLGTTVVMVTHDKQLSQRAGRIINVKDGIIQ